MTAYYDKPPSPLGDTLWQLCRTSRFYSVPYLTLATTVGLLSTTSKPTPLQLCAALLTPGCFALGIAAWNDLAHLAADERAGRGRTTDRGWLIRTGSVGSLLALGSASAGGWSMLGGVVGSLVTGVAYAKGKSVPLLANLLRGLTTGSIVLGATAMGGTVRHEWAYVLGVALLDSAGNIWGDVRDATVDRHAGTRTIATVQPQIAPLIALGLHTLATALLATKTPLVWLTLPFGASLLRTPPRRTHEYFLQIKYLVLTLIGLRRAASPAHAALMIMLGMGVIPATWLYRRLHGNTPSLAH
jgi:4-hydroxybenzoate polyprenyltransferase